MDKDKLTETERKFLEKAGMKKYDIYRYGWPDFLLVPVRRSRERIWTPFCVEVKKDGQTKLSSSQRKMRKGLKRCGLPVLVSGGGKWIEPSEDDFREMLNGLDKLNEAENHIAGVIVEKHDEITRELRGDIIELFKRLKERLYKYRLKKFPV